MFIGFEYLENNSINGLFFILFSYITQVLVVNISRSFVNWSINKTLLRVKGNILLFDKYSIQVRGFNRFPFYTRIVGPDKLRAVYVGHNT